MLYIFKQQRWSVECFGCGQLTLHAFSHTLPCKCMCAAKSHIYCIYNKCMHISHARAEWTPSKPAHINYLLTVGGEGDEMCSHLHQCTERFTKFVHVNIQLMFHCGDSERERGSSYVFPLWIWGCLDKNRTVELWNSIFFFFFLLHICLVWKCTFSFSHLTWWLHCFPEGTEYISESGCLTEFLSARKQQL